MFSTFRGAVRLLLVSNLLVALLAARLTAAADVSGNQPPNILWITAEDMSPTLGSYGDDFATTPNIDALARQSSKYSHAFATAPVCSPSRACLINGCIATSQGTHPMRSQLPLPDGMNGFPALLRQAGYFTTNNVKTDYNTAAEPRIIQRSWSQNSSSAHWRHCPEGQPFFSVFNFMTTHQSRTMVWPYEQFQDEVQARLSADEIHDPNRVPLPPYYPDTPLVRQTVARYYDCVTVLDKQVGDLLDELEADGLADDTIVFFFSDHGSGMPRHKRALLDSGMRVPLLLRFPEKYRHWAPTGSGQWTDRLVNFEDFAPTVLSLAGVSPMPEFFRGTAFLGPQAGRPHRYIFGHRDRVDETFDKARSVRSKDYLYIRNFMPHRGYNQVNAWSDQAAVRQDFYDLARSGKATAAQSQYLNDRRPREELYNCVDDPLNLRNLAESPEHQKKLRTMRLALQRHLIDSRDLGFVPEIELHKHAITTTPMQWAQTDAFQIRPILAAAALVGSDRFTQTDQALQDPNVSVRYWATVACTAADQLNEALRVRLHERLQDSSAAVRIEAAGALAHHGDTEAAYSALQELLHHPDEIVLLYTARTIQLLADPVHRDAMAELYDRFEEAPGDIAWFIRFSTSAYLSRLDQPSARQ